MKKYFFKDLINKSLWSLTFRPFILVKLSINITNTFLENNTNYTVNLVKACKFWQWLENKGRPNCKNVLKNWIIVIMWTTWQCLLIVKLSHSAEYYKMIKLIKLVVNTMKADIILFNLKYICLSPEWYKVGDSEKENLVLFQKALLGLWESSQPLDRV